MIKTIRLFLLLMHYEIRMNSRNLTWVIGLAAAVLVVLSETSMTWRQWPTLNQSLFAFHESVRLIVSIVAFLLAANSVAREGSGARKHMIHSRPVNLWLFSLAKFTGACMVSIGLALLIMVIVILRPWLAGLSTPYSLMPFLPVLVWMVLPSLFYITSLAILLTAVTGRLIVSIPLYLGYLFFALYYAGHQKNEVIFSDFTMRMEPVRVGIRLHSLLFGPGDFSFARYFNPLHPELITKTGIYLGLTLLLLAVGGWILQKQRGN
ncbi:hypothetical protein GF373_12345 [bacterium]|nr:hypothetical protein [bacterium]